MDKPRIYPAQGPEEKIVQDLIKFLSERDWKIRRTHGNLWQSGFPDLWIGHPMFGKRWVETKNPLSYSFTPAQREFFPIMHKCGDGIWILTGATQSEYDKLFSKPNWFHYMGVKG